MAEEANAKKKRQRRLGILMGERAVRKKTREQSPAKAARASTQRSQINKST